MITCKHNEIIEEVLEKLIKTYKDVKIARGPRHSYLGMSFDFNVSGKAKIM